MGDNGTTIDINKKGTTVLMATHDFNIIQKYPSKTFKCENKKNY